MKEYKKEIKIFFIALVSFNIIFFANAVRNKKVYLNEQLRKTITLLEKTLPHSINDRLIGREKVDTEMVKSISWYFSLYRESENLKYCYTIIQTEKGMQYTLSGLPLEVFDNNEFEDYYLYKITPEEDSIYQIKKDMIDGKRGVFQGVYEDKFGKYHAMISPYKTEKGNTVLIGAEYDYKDYREWIFFEVLTIVFINSLIFIGILALIFIIYQKHEKDKEGIIKEGMTDHLTGLYTRKGLKIIKDKVLSVPPTLWGILYFDLDGLKKINDSKGHDAGDLYIVGFANILKTVFRHEDLLMRVGGDEFLVVAEIADKSNVDLIHSRLDDESLNKGIHFSMGSLLLETSEIEDIEDIIKEVDARMYKQKKEKKERLRKLSADSK